MLGWLGLGSKGEKIELDMERTYLRIEFLTAQEKTLKKEKMKALQNKYEQDPEVIIPYEGSFSCSFSFVLNTATIKGLAIPIRNSIMVKELISYIEIPVDSKLQDFLTSYVKEKLFLLSSDEVVVDMTKLIQDQYAALKLYNERDVSVYTPEEVLEIIYEPKTLWERIKQNGRAVIKSIPGRILSMFGRLATVLLSSIGLGGGYTGLIWKMMPTKSILSWVVTIITMFFPMLAPLLSIGKMMM